MSHRAPLQRQWFNMAHTVLTIVCVSLGVKRATYLIMLRLWTPDVMREAHAAVGASEQSYIVFIVLES